LHLIWRFMCGMTQLASCFGTMHFETRPIIILYYG
jgi:hypothetical protein